MYYEPLTPNILRDSLNYLDNNTLDAPITICYEDIRKIVNDYIFLIYETFDTIHLMCGGDFKGLHIDKRGKTGRDLLNFLKSHKGYKKILVATMDYKRKKVIQKELEDIWVFTDRDTNTNNIRIRCTATIEN